MKIFSFDRNDASQEEGSLDVQHTWETWTGPESKHPIYGMIDFKPLVYIIMQEFLFQDGEMLY